MDITVVDERAEEERESYTTTIFPLDVDPEVHPTAYREPLQLPHNPESYDATIDSRWVANNVAGVSHHDHGSSWETTYPMSESFSIVMQPEDPDLCDFIKRCLIFWSSRPTTHLGRPTRVRVQHGIHIIQGHIEHLSFSAMRTDEKGRIRTMSMEFSVVENQPQPRVM